MSAWAGCRRCKAFHEFATLAEAETFVKFSSRGHGEDDAAKIIDEATVLAPSPKPWQIHRLISLTELT